MKKQREIRKPKELLKDLVAKKLYLTLSIVPSYLKVNVSCAWEDLFELLKNEVINTVDEYSSKYCCFVKGPKYVEEAKAKKEGAKDQKGAKEDKGKQQPKEGKKKEKAKKGKEKEKEEMK